MEDSRPARLSLMAFVLVLVTSVVSASSIEVAVTKSAVEGSQPGRVLYVAFTDAPVTVDVTVSVDEDESDAALAKLDRERWWQQLTWTLRDLTSGADRTLPPRAVAAVSATRNPLVSAGKVQHRGIFRIGTLPAGNYALRVGAGGVEGRDAFAIRNGTESPAVRNEFLRLKAERTTKYEEFKKIQMERTQIQPNRADVWIELAMRGLESGTAEETSEYFSKAIALMEKNAADYARREPSKAKEVRRRVSAAVANVRALQDQFPYYFENRKRLKVVEEPVDGAMRYVLKERSSGRVDRVIVPAGK